MYCPCKEAECSQCEEQGFLACDCNAENPCGKECGQYVPPLVASATRIGEALIIGLILFAAMLGVAGVFFGWPT